VFALFEVCVGSVGATEEELVSDPSEVDVSLFGVEMVLFDLRGTMGVCVCVIDVVVVFVVVGVVVVRELVVIVGVEVVDDVCVDVAGRRSLPRRERSCFVD